jgi:hypothetical protein
VWSSTGVIEATGVIDLLLISQKAMRIYPNPVVNKTATVQLQKPFTQHATLRVMDATGRILKQQLVPAGETTIQLQLSELSPGIYLIQLTTPKGIIAKTFIVQ